MKKLTFTFILQIAILSISVSGQVKPNLTNGQPNSISAGTSTVTPAPRTRVLGSSTRPEIVSRAAAGRLTQLYRVGVGDVLDVQLPQRLTTKSTLFTVLQGGVIDYPLVGELIPVAGLTTQQISERLRERIKVLDRPTVKVNVRDYASHTVTVVGFVSAPGEKTLRREAVPLFVLLSEALPLPEATQATIIRSGQSPITVNLKDSVRTSILVSSGDTVKVLATPGGPSEFFFTGGAINSSGQKPYHTGLTLTQAILASGGLRKDAGNKVRISRQAADGRLVSFEHNLRLIQTGRVADPVVQRDDRLEVSVDQ